MEVTGALARIFPPPVACAVGRAGHAPPGSPEEEASLTRASAERIAEFRAGRACARAAVARLGTAARAILVGPRRAPVWPAGLVGSITHCPGIVAAAAAPARRIAALGLDAEPAVPLPDGVGPLVLHAGEHGPGVAPTVVFSAKEAVFKALFPLTGAWIEPLDVVVRLDPDRGRFEVAPAVDGSPVAEMLARVEGRYALAQGFVLAGCWVVAADESDRTRV